MQNTTLKIGEMVIDLSLNLVQQKFSTKEDEMELTKKIDSKYSTHDNENINLEN